MPLAAGDDKPPIVQGSLDLLVLKTLSTGRQHGYAIARNLFDRSGEFLNVEEGSLYPALHRLEKRGWVTSEWGESERKRRARYYKLTAKGLAQLKMETAAWKRMAEAIDRVLNFRESEGFA
jgi:PadR family transcriptional regulator, regulatory protein PadR